MIYIYLFIYSSIWFSFLHVSAQNIPTGKNYLFRLSKCDYCGSDLSFMDILPIISYILKRGKTTCCKQKLQKIYFVIEIISPTIIIIFYHMFQFNYEFFLATTIFIFLTFFLITDIYYLYIPYSIMICFFFSYFFFLRQTTLFEYIGIILLNVCIYLFCFHGIGSGDIALITILGFFLGWRGMYIILLISTIVAMAILVMMYSMKKIGKNTKVPFVPFIYIGYLIYIIYFFPKG